MNFTGEGLLFYTIVATVGALTMDIFGPQAFYGSIGIMLDSVAVFTLWRSTQRADVEIADQGDFVVMATSPLTCIIEPGC
jgi:hypothetical protein